MQWEATDQFGNLYIGISDSTGLDDLQPEINSLVEELARRAPTNRSVSVDFSYGEIKGPNPDEVSHIIQVPWLTEIPDRFDCMRRIQSMVDEASASLGVETCPVQEC